MTVCAIDRLIDRLDEILDNNEKLDLNISKQ